VVLVRLDEIEVGSFALREAVLSVKLELSGYDRVLTPAVHVKGSLGEDEDASVRDTVTGAGSGTSGWDLKMTTVSLVCGSGYVSLGSRDVIDSDITEKTVGVDSILSLVKRAEGKDGVGESVNGISVVEWLGTKSLVHSLASNEGVTVSDVHIRLDNPDKLLTRMIEIELNLVGR
tara:strand:- start:42 stop:566 length:525 start_codon:yes stop_codon:yes gene_type:complete